LRVDPVPAGAVIVLRAFAGATMIQNEPSETATEVWRMPDGSWHFNSVEFYVRRPISPSGAAMTGSQAEQARHTVRTGRLDSRQSEGLERLMADPCLEAEPAAIGSLIEVGEGVEQPEPCFDGTTEVVEIERGGKRNVFSQYCPKLLVGDLLNVALYPRTEDTERAAREAGWKIATSAEARQAGDAMIARYDSSAVWENVTSTATIELRHRRSGFRCAFDGDPSAEVFGTPDWDSASLSGNCYMHWGRVETRSIIRRGLEQSGLQATMRDAAPQHIGNAWKRQPLLYAIDRTRIGGKSLFRASLPDFPRYDARDETFTIVLGAVMDGWIVVQSTTGPSSERERIERTADDEWRKLMSMRSPTGRAR
jgi:hypothetical protein